MAQGGQQFSDDARVTNKLEKKVAVVQSNYIPWKGYFDLINLVDEFILYDERQYTRRDWRNRNIIKTSKGPIWLTIPVDVKGKYFQNPNWGKTHWTTIVHNYSKARYFAMHREVFENLYLHSEERFLSRVNYLFLSAICEILGIKAKISWSMDYNPGTGKTERLVDLSKQAGATEYISGPRAKDYLEEELFSNAGIALNSSLHHSNIRLASSILFSMRGLRRRSI